jgi:peptide methionine sulfoxide reductase msrA/msrB
MKRFSFSRLALCAIGTVAQAACAQSSVAVPEPPVDPIRSGLHSAVLAGGCFWGVEEVFQNLKGVQEVRSGYAGGSLPNPTYEQVGGGATGHAEAVLIRFDASAVSYGTLLKVFFSVAHDPTQLNYQGPDVGTQYRSAVFYSDEEQRRTAEGYIAALARAKAYPRRIVTQVAPLKAFYPAEDYHQDFMRRNPRHPYIQRWDAPKIKELRARFPGLLASGEATESAWYGYRVFPQGTEVPVPIAKSEAEWKRQLAEPAYSILRKEATERAFTHPLNGEHRKGTYYSAATGQPLFRSEAKFDSGTGWPSFSKPIEPGSVILKWDDLLGYPRVEVEDASSGSHLGHVFDDGPGPSGSFPEGTGLRFCMNGASLVFVPDGSEVPQLVRNYLNNQRT